jgi:hypothetical protein
MAPNITGGKVMDPNTYYAELEIELRRMLNLLSDRQVGLVTWNWMMQESRKQLLHLLNDSTPPFTGGEGR